MKIEAGKFYRTRDGRKVGPMWDCGSGPCTDRWKAALPSEGEAFWNDDGSHWVGKTLASDLIAEWTDEYQPDTPKLWRDMTPEEKGAMLLAHHEGRVVEVWGENGWWSPCSIGQYQCCAYRIRPEPKRETVTLYGDPSRHVQWCMDQCPNDTHSITFDMIDGKPDPASIQMKPLD